MTTVYKINANGETKEFKDFFEAYEYGKGYGAVPIPYVKDSQGNEILRSNYLAQ